VRRFVWTRWLDSLFIKDYKSMRVEKVLLGLVVVIAGLLLVGPARADEVTFTLTQNTCTGGCSPSPFATVVVTTAGQAANTVLVTETLTGATQFAITGAGNALAFSVAGNPTLTIGNLTSTFSIGNASAGKTIDEHAAGIYEYWILCSGCGHGTSNPVTGPLSFTAEAPGLTAASFEVLNNNNFYISSDVLATNTGNVEANGFVDPTPEPASIALFGTGLLGIGFILRKRLFA